MTHKLIDHFEKLTIGNKEKCKMEIKLSKILEKFNSYPELKKEINSLMIEDWNVTDYMTSVVKLKTNKMKMSRHYNGGIVSIFINDKCIFCGYHLNVKNIDRLPELPFDIPKEVMLDFIKTIWVNFKKWKYV